MIRIQKVKTWDGEVKDLEILSAQEQIIDANHLTLLPGLIDAHVHFRTPGLEHKENWKTAAKAAIKGGITTVFDMPNTIPPCISLELLHQKKQRIDEQLKEVGIPLSYGLYLGADKFHFHEIPKCKKEIVGLKVFMGSSTGNLVIDDESSLHAVFALAAAHDLLLAVHAEDEHLISVRTKLFAHLETPHKHSQIRNAEVALRATQKALQLAKMYKTRLYLLHISTKQELLAIKEAKKEGVLVFAETTPHHLFLTEEAYDLLGTKAQMNPPLRTQEDCNALWEAIQEGTIDTIGSDHAPHTHEEKQEPYGIAPSGVPGVETTLPLLLDASHRGKLSLEKIVHLMYARPREIFRLPPHEDLVLVDMNKEKKVEDSLLETKCKWSPFHGKILRGWPVYTILKGKVYEHK